MGLLKLQDPDRHELLRDTVRKQSAEIKRLKRLQSLKLVGKDHGLVGAHLGPTFLTQVQYVQPTFAELGSRFAFVHSALDGASIETINRCQHVSREQRERVFGSLTLDRDATVDECLIMHDRSGLRPALYEELVAFGQWFPEELRKCEGVAALGSVVQEAGEFCSIPFLYTRFCDLELDTVWIGSDLPKGFKLLGVYEGC